MAALEFAESIASLPSDKQDEFFERLKSELGEEDWKAIVKFISLVKLFKSPAKYEAMKNAVCDMLCEEFYGHTVGRKNKPDDPYNPDYMYSNSIL